MYALIIITVHKKSSKLANWYLCVCELYEQASFEEEARIVYDDVIKSNSHAVQSAVIISYYILAHGSQETRSELWEKT